MIEVTTRIQSHTGGENIELTKENTRLQQISIALRENKVALTECKEELERTITALEKREAELERANTALEKQNTEFQRANTALTEQKTELDRTNIALTERKTELEDANMEAGKANTALQNENASLKERLAQLEQDNASLTAREEEKDKQLARFEEHTSGLEKDLKDERAKNKGLNETVRKNAGNEERLEKYIASAEDGNNKLKSDIKSLEKERDHVAWQLSHEKLEHRRTKDEYAALGLKLKKLSEDADGVRKLLEAKQEESDRKSETISTLNARIESLEQVEADLTEARNVTGGLQDQLLRLTDELPRFNPDPKVFMAPAVPKPDEKARMPRSLADDLGSGPQPDNLNGNGSPHPSDDDDSEHSSPPSDDGDKNEVAVQVEIREVIREVSGATICVFVPYRTSWFQVEIDAIKLFQAWLLSTGHAVPFILNWIWMKLFGRPLFGGNPQPTNVALPAVPAQNQGLVQPHNGINGGGSTSSTTNPTNGANQVHPQPSTPSTNGNTEPGPAVPPPNYSNGTADIPDETLPVVAQVARRSWWKADVDPNAPAAASTLFALALHLIFYFLLYVCIFGLL